ncbi:MAG: 6-phosphofructokinase [Defluviitaleaceae bacterium]|nr:6-phosphofructokinase [Defluviitaleaceae bacterium]MCL2275613.1 6-phosphofructokinase [Defluviitaleaceae bacterium]
MAEQKKLKLGVLTSGGDAPGMNAAIRSVVRTAHHYGIRSYGIKTGYEGLFAGDIEEIDHADVSGIIHRGGTILRTARCAQMMTEEGQKKAAEIIKILRLDAIVIIGGDGSFRGALALSKLGVNVMAIPATIDLDMDCTDYTIGFDTAVNTAADAIIRIRDTSSSHERCSVVEVMGRNSGRLAIMCGLVGGAEEVLIPENPVDTSSVIEQVLHNRSQGKHHNLIVVAEGVGNSNKLAKEIERVLGIEARATVLGHFQRGGTPTARDRMHATIMGYTAVKGIVDDEKSKAVVYRHGKHVLLDIEEATTAKKEYSPRLYDMTKILAI